MEFKQVKCTGFLKKVRDGIFIDLDKTTLTADLVNINLVGEFSSGVVKHDIELAEKTYYEHRNGNFKGVVVGYIDVVTVGYLEVFYQVNYIRHRKEQP